MGNDSYTISIHSTDFIHMQKNDNPLSDKSCAHVTITREGKGAEISLTE